MERALQEKEVKSGEPMSREEEFQRLRSQTGFEEYIKSYLSRGTRGTDENLSVWKQGKLAKKIGIQNTTKKDDLIHSATGKFTFKWCQYSLWGQINT